MASSPARLMTTALWPLTVWPSVFDLEKHPADNFAERTFPLIATAIGFWVCVGLLVYVSLQVGPVVSIDTGDGGSSAARLVPRWIDGVSGVLWFFLPALYVIGLWLFAARDEAFPG
ncbi:MAG: hypothetical protein K2X34_09015 [Hyphomonadaceae bacterium]|nr:hypothetical protein [Hyphomonadaceae bacterium]